MLRWLPIIVCYWIGVIVLWFETLFLWDWCCFFFHIILSASPTLFILILFRVTFHYCTQQIRMKPYNSTLHKIVATVCCVQSISFFTTIIKFWPIEQQHETDNNNVYKYIIHSIHDRITFSGTKRMNECKILFCCWCANFVLSLKRFAFIWKRK